MKHALATVGAVDMASLSLSELEAVIERGQQTFIEVGAARGEIQERRLYRQKGRATFEQYIANRWERTRRIGYTYIEAAEVTANVQSIAQTAQSLTQSIALAPLPAAEQRTIAQEVDFATSTVRECRLYVRRTSKGA